MKNSFEFVVDTLLDLFMNLDTGYLAKRKGRLSGDMQANNDWFEYARSLAGDNKELTYSKILVIKDFIEKVRADMIRPLSISKNLSIDTEPSNIIKVEVEQLKNRIELLLEYTNTAALAIKDKRERVNKAPGEADSLLEVWKYTILWLLSSDTLGLLHMVLSFESESIDPPMEGLKKQREYLENTFVSDIFKLLFTVKLDELLHSGREYTNYVRMVPDYVTEELLSVFPTAINSLQEYFMTSPPPNAMHRTKKLIELIQSLQYVTTKCFNKIEEKRYSILPDRAALYLPSFTPSLVVSNPNKFLKDLDVKLESFHNLSKTLELEQRDMESKIKAKHLTANIG